MLASGHKNDAWGRATSVNGWHPRHMSMECLASVSQHKSTEGGGLGRIGAENRARRCCAAPGPSQIYVSQKDGRNSGTRQWQTR